MPALSLSTSILELPLVHPFTIARGSADFTSSVIARLSWNGLEGLGETAPIVRYGETAQSVRAYFQDHPVRGDDPYLVDDLLDAVEPAAARCALDIALHDLIAKDCEQPLFRLLGLDPSKTPVTSFTIGIADPETTLRKVAELGTHPVMKLKLGSGTPQSQIETVEAIRGEYTGTIRIDANEGWDAQTAVQILGELARFEIEFCEQPIPAGSPEQLRFIREHSNIPIVTDEDSLTARDLPALFGCVDGVNVKLVKTGGIRGALAMIHTARALGFKIMIGCMVESAILATAAAQISPLCDWADIDGPFLTKDDPFEGLTYDDGGKIVLPSGAGLGISEKSAVA